MFLFVFNRKFCWKLVQITDWRQGCNQLIKAINVSWSNTIESRPTIPIIKNTLNLAKIFYIVWALNILTFVVLWMKSGNLICAHCVHKWPKQYHQPYISHIDQTPEIEVPCSKVWLKTTGILKHPVSTVAVTS